MRKCAQNSSTVKRRKRNKRATRVRQTTDPLFRETFLSQVDVDAGSMLPGLF